MRGIEIYEIFCGKFMYNEFIIIYIIALKRFVEFDCCDMENVEELCYV